MQNIVVFATSVVVQNLIRCPIHLVAIIQIDMHNIHCLGLIISSLLLAVIVFEIGDLHHRTCLDLLCAPSLLLRDRELWSIPRGITLDSHLILH